jgi:hypothetical protein
MDTKVVMGLSRALRGELGPNQQRFLEQRGYTLQGVIDQGGTMVILAGLIPDSYPTVEALVEAIEKA